MASVVTQETWSYQSLKKLTFEWTADTDGSVDAVSSNIRFDGIPQAVEVVPGTPSPTASYAITLKNEYGRDILGGGGTGLSATAAAALTPSPEGVPVTGGLTLAITGNSVNGAKGKVVIYFYEI